MAFARFNNVLCKYFRIAYVKHFLIWSRGKQLSMNCNRYRHKSNWRNFKIKAFFVVLTHLLDDKTLHWSKLKQFTEDILKGI